MNPMQIIQMIKSGSNPQQLIMSFLQQQNNPMANNLLQMAQNGNTSGIGGMNDGNKKMGHSPMKRKSYIESKERHMDQALQMQELEDYAQELTSDLMEMIQDATPEEKQLLQRKIATLATKIV